jgi:uncharacterized damage-inducible protein DinB
MVALTGNELRAWVEYTTEGWKKFFAAHPEALAFPCDVRETKTVAQFLRHIVAVELLFAERLHGLAGTPFEEIPYDSLDVIYTTHNKAMVLLRDLDGQEDVFWENWMEFPMRKGGSIRTPRRVVLVHLLMHSIRHYAQLATLVRQHGVATELHLDYLLMRPKEPAV